jgi:hypothetical protein
MKRTSKLKEMALFVSSHRCRWFNRIFGYVKTDTQAAYAFLKRLVKQFDEPKVVVTDKAPSITSAFKKLKEYGFYQGQNIVPLNT